MSLRSKIGFSPSTLLRASLLIVILLVGCAPASTPEPTQLEVPSSVENEPTTAPLPTVTVVQPEEAPTEAPTMEVLPTEAPTEVPQVAATSRGPNLEATDPATYTRASGGLQLVEFFAFW